MPAGHQDALGGDSTQTAGGAADHPGPCLGWTAYPGQGLATSGWKAMWAHESLEVQPGGHAITVMSPNKVKGTAEI